MASTRDSPPPLQIVNGCYFSESDDDDEEEMNASIPAPDADHSLPESRPASPNQPSSEQQEDELPPPPPPPSSLGQEASCSPEADEEDSDGDTSDDENHDVESAAASCRKSRVVARKYAIRLEKLPEETQRLISQMAKFFTETINLQRRSTAISKTTMNKARERILCKYSVLNSYRGRQWVPSELSQNINVSVNCRLPWILGTRRRSRKNRAHSCSL